LVGSITSFGLSVDVILRADHWQYLSLDLAQETNGLSISKF
jgi:hypothetical protein